ncbi:MAG: RNA 2',3'-cyclic phosphodiesterase [Candidatus Desulfofervidaceae bacterium]|nr:RNA 2',3'-cyclic phosphodiesterase [Candidatus Desulfofervidaceae bacterium]MDL1969475.1 RNA 2',3'-cyclic phosphodiesterase [Candidatus Desulfofervidaceae bacterium]
MIRSFIAIPLPEEVKKALAGLVQALRPIFPKINWVKLENMHLTLKFLGNIREDQITQIKRVIVESCRDVSSFSLQGHGLGVFPNVKRARVIWTGVCGETDLLEKIYFALEKRLAQIGFPEEKRRFQPHLTLGRIKTGASSKLLLEAIQRYQAFSTSSFTVKEIVLFKSNLHPQGARYTALERVELGMGNE